MSLVVQRQTARPGLIGIVWCGKRTYVTRPSDWSVMPAPNKVTADTLAKAAGDGPGTYRLTDLGALGVPPWKYIPGVYLGSKAHWIWPRTNDAKTARRWLLQLHISTP